jgi:hypothetical protein
VRDDVEVCTGGIARIGAGLGGTARTTASHWSWWTVVCYQLLIGLFKFKFNHLNMNLIV